LVFAPVERDGLLLVDGGLINPIPIAPTLNDNSAWTLAVDLNARAEAIEMAEKSEELAESDSPVRKAISRFLDNVLPAGRKSEDETDFPGPIELALRSLDTMQTTIGRMKLAAYAPRFVINVPRNLSTLFEFHRADELIDFGYRRACEVLDREK
jgi:NTE family protein